MMTIEEILRHTAQLLADIEREQSIDENGLWDICEILALIDDLDVAFCAFTPERVLVHWYGRDIVKAIEVFFQASGGVTVGHSRQVSQRSIRRRETDEMLKKLVRVLQELTGVTFCLAWRFQGENDVTLYHSPDQSWDNAKKELFDDLTNEFGEQVNYVVSKK